MRSRASSSEQPVRWLVSVLRWPTDDARRWAERAFSRLCSDPNIAAVVLFGSAVRPVESSFDFDCLYIYQGDKPVVPPAPIEVDLRGYAADQVDTLIQNAHDLLIWSIRFGKLVCERNEYWTDLVARWNSVLPFPSAEVAEDRALKAERLLQYAMATGDEDAVVEQLVTAATHRARAALLRAQVFPASRPELPDQLRTIGEHELAENLKTAMRKRQELAAEFIRNRPAADAA